MPPAYVAVSWKQNWAWIRMWTSKQFRIQPDLNQHLTATEPALIQQRRLACWKDDLYFGLHFKQFYVEKAGSMKYNSSSFA
jgi:hypothetical protein